jgi:amino-acid N-acetyltransferase
MPTTTIDRATSADGPAILDLLAANSLPGDGLLEHLHHAFVARSGSRIVGCAALEVYGDGALLRSVAVDAGFRGQGLGERLSRSAVDLATTLELPAVYLLTTTAERFFPKLGFGRIPRDHVPPGVQQSIEFRSVCCASAAVMMKPLTGADGC